MAFKNVPDQRYYLIAKHSGKALGFANNSLGCKLTQMTLDPDNENQKFTFISGGDFYWIMPRKNERYLAVNASSQNNEAALIQWHWEEKQNLQFHLDPAGDGYYRIRALHSNKFLDVIYADKKDASEVVQIQLSGTDNQLFRPVPVVGDPAGINPTTYLHNEETLRTVLLGLIGAIPKVGGVSAVIGFFWSSKNTLSNLWDQLKSYVDVRVHELLEQKLLEELRDDLEGVLSNAKNFDGLTSRTAEKGAKLVATLTFAEGRRPHFFNKKASVLPYLVGLGTIMIALHHKLVTDYEEVFGHKPTENDARLHLTGLQECIARFTREAAKHRNTLLNARMALIRDPQESANMYDPACTAKDAFDNWTMTFFPSVESEKGAYMPSASNAVVQRRKQVNEQYASELDEMMEQAKTWKYFDPAETEKYISKKIKRSVGAFGGVHHTVAFSGHDNTDIRYITLWHGDDGVLTGLTLGYDQKPEVTAGKVSGQSTKLELGKGEYIASAYGYMYKSIECLGFNTQKGRIAGAGKKKRTPFSADLSDGLNAKLVSISGAHNHKWIEQLTFHWAYDY